MLSVCLATYNGEDFVVRQLESVLKQLNDSDQVVVVDDCSKDQTVSLIKETFGGRVEVFVNASNSGPVKSFEKAISLAKGDIVFLCDQDDIWEDEKVERVLDAFQNQEADLVIHDAYVVDGNLQTIHSSWNQYNNNQVNQGIMGNIMKNAFTGAMMAFRKELVPLFLPLPGTIEMHDQWIAIAAMLNKKKIVTIQEPLMKYVRHGGNVTGMKKRSLFEQIEGRLGTVTAILRYRK
ncbi:glycosyltransferase [Robertmurraya korlensis]|uniref:glycosyltransferase n=1 Tax=Robertmurraya korlensis TaxID=519977 RepID=UPI00203B5D3E|nr:glycosyltransferase [Robertmurraya korlensis]MCM3602672.1 glycosyltransferase [Robertmurraya korlensis]